MFHRLTDSDIPDFYTCECAEKILTYDTNRLIEMSGHKYTLLSFEHQIMPLIVVQTNYNMVGYRSS